MSYHLHAFGGEPTEFANGVFLPTGESVDGLGAEVPSDAVATAGGSHFAYGSGVVPLGVHRINHRGIYFADVETSVNNFFGLLGQRKKLWRKREDDGDYQWKYARLLRCHWDRDVSQSQHAEIISEFEATGYWKSAGTQNVYQTRAVQYSAGEETYTLATAGNGEVPTYDAVITINSGSGDLKMARLKDSDGGIDWTWSGYMDNYKNLKIDCGAFSVQNDGVNAYSTFVLNEDHARDYWCAILPGSTSFQLTLQGYCTFKIEWYDSWV